LVRPVTNDATPVPKGAGVSLFRSASRARATQKTYTLLAPSRGRKIKKFFAFRLDNVVAVVYGCDYKGENGSPEKERQYQ
jgi:hypothetical protein